MIPRKNNSFLLQLEQPAFLDSSSETSHTIQQRNWNNYNYWRKNDFVAFR